MYKDFKYVVTDEDVHSELQVKDFLRQHFNFSSRLLSKIKKNKGIRLNGKCVASWIVPKKGDIITIELPKEKSDFQPADIPISVVYEDQNLLVIDKQPGFIVHPTSTHKDNTIANGIAKYCLETNQDFKLRFVNRLDRDTSGLLILGKNSHCQDKITKQMKNNLVEKRYLALVHGIITEEKGSIDLPIGRPSDIEIKRKVMEGGSHCLTNYKVLERYYPKENSFYNPIDRCDLDNEIFRLHEDKKNNNLKISSDKMEFYKSIALNQEDTEIVHKPGFTLIELHIETGRTHQIRVHMSFIGHPIVHDTLYGTASNIIDRQILHAKSLKFKHPTTEEAMYLEAPLPSDILSGIEKIKK